MSTRPHVVRQGDCFASLAARHGVTIDALRNHDRNASIRDLRRDPHVLAAGDIVHVPVPPQLRSSLSAGRANRFKVRVDTTPLVLDMKDPSGQKMADKAYRLRVGGLVIEGRTNGEGRIEARVPILAREAEFTVWAGDSQDEDLGTTWVLDIGHMDPEEETSGAVARLENLGIPVHPAPGGLEAALRVFQQIAGIETTGQLDDRTRSALREAAGV